MKRRTFIKTCCIGLAGATLLHRPCFAAAVAGTESPHKPVAASPLSQSFRYANFEAHVGEVFSVFSKGIEGVGEVVDLQLVEVVKIHIDDLTEQFSVRFSRPDDYLLAEGLYIFDSVSDEFSLYLRPDTRTKGLAYYLAELNLLLQEPE